MPNFLRLPLRILKWIIILFFVSTVLAVVVYRFVPVSVTPLMLIRSAEAISEGRPAGWHHQWVPLEKMSKYMAVAVMASEDQNFLKHNGFDFGAIQDAVEEKMEGGRSRGASTISQQTAKNVFLWPTSSWVRKGFETYFTVLIELIWSKERIMEVYLNSIEMGNGIYGVEAVARQHFGTDAASLTRADCALIAATLPNPRRYSSLQPSRYMRKRRKQIQVQMKYIPLLPVYTKEAE